MELRSPILLNEMELTPIQEFYKSTNIFITGGTGFLGKILIQKLLISCPGIENIYLLVRNKKGKDVHSRVEEIFEDPMFDTLKEKVPKFRHVVQGMAGDCLQAGLGLSAQDRETLISKVNIVFHMAATVRFDEKLKIAMKINVQACKDILTMSSEMKNLKSLIHVSTAYTQSPLDKVEEKFYPPPIDAMKMLGLTDSAPDKLLEDITPMLLDKWPNTYTFTKAMAEDVVRQLSVGIPVGMFRPGIVISTYREPTRGWIDNFYGPTGVIAGAGTGVIRTFRCNPNCDANMVPVDMCVNGIIACAWDVNEKFQNKITIESNEVPIYNYCTGPTNKISWEDFTSKTIKYGVSYPTMKAIWYLVFAHHPNKFVHIFTMIFLHYLPAVLFDFIAMIIGKKPRLIKTYKKIHHYMNVVQYFSLKEWDFSTNNIQTLYKKLTHKDKNLFYFDMTSLDWDEFLESYFLGVRKYLLNDPIETLPAARTRWNRLYWLHQSVKLFLYALCLRSVWSFYSMFCK